MFRFGKKKKPKPGKQNDDDFYRPQPVSLQRGWATTANQNKSKKSVKKQHPTKLSNSLNKNPPDTASESKKQPSEHAKSENNVAATDPMPSQSSSQLNHAQSAKNMMPTSLQSEASNSNNNSNYNEYDPYEHKQNESLDSNYSAQSMPTYNNNKLILICTHPCTKRT